MSACTEAAQPANVTVRRSAGCAPRPGRSTAIEGADMSERVRSQQRPSRPPPWTRTTGSMAGSLDGLIPNVQQAQKPSQQKSRRCVMRDVVVVEAVRSPVGRRKGGLSAMHSADLLGAVQRAVVERSGIDPAEVEQV